MLARLWPVVLVLTIFTPAVSWGDKCTQFVQNILSHCLDESKCSTGEDVFYVLKDHIEGGSSSKVLQGLLEDRFISGNYRIVFHPPAEHRDIQRLRRKNGDPLRFISQNISNQLRDLQKWLKDQRAIMNDGTVFVISNYPLDNREIGELRVNALKTELKVSRGVPLKLLSDDPKQIGGVMTKIYKEKVSALTSYAIERIELILNKASPNAVDVWSYFPHTTWVFYANCN